MQNVRNDDEVQNWFCMRALLRSLACSAVLIPISRALAQFPSPNPTSTQIEESMKAQATSANIQTWLESKDPRLIAWGAYFARENNDTAALDLAAQLVKKSLEQGGPDLLSPGGPPVRRAIRSIGHADSKASAAVRRYARVCIPFSSGPDHHPPLHVAFRRADWKPYAVVLRAAPG